MNELYDRCNDWAFLQQRTKLELFRQNHQRHFLPFWQTHFSYRLVVSLTTNVRQVYHSLSSFHP